MALAFGTVVMTRSSVITLVVRFLNRLLREPISRFSFTLPNLCLIFVNLYSWPYSDGLFIRRVFGNLFHHGTRGRGRRRHQMALRIRLHAQSEAHAVEDFLDLVQRLATEVLRTQHLRFRLLHQFV